MKINSPFPGFTNDSGAFAFLKAEAPGPEKQIAASHADNQKAPIGEDDRSAPRSAEPRETLLDSAIATILRWKLSDKRQRGGDDTTAAGKNAITSALNANKRKFYIEARSDSAGMDRPFQVARTGGSSGDPASMEPHHRDS